MVSCAFLWVCSPNQQVTRNNGTSDREFIEDVRSRFSKFGTTGALKASYQGYTLPTMTFHVSMVKAISLFAKASGMTIWDCIYVNMKSIGGQTGHLL